MQEKKKYISLYYFAHCCFIAALIFFVLFLLDHSNFVKLSFLLLFLILYLVLSYLCNKALQCEGGYSLIQAIGFYQACKRAGYRGSMKKKDVETLTRVAQRLDYLDNTELEYLRQCYIMGRQAEQAVTNPVIRRLWSLRSKIGSRKKEK